MSYQGITIQNEQSSTIKFYGSIYFPQKTKKLENGSLLQKNQSSCPQRFLHPFDRQQGISSNFRRLLFHFLP
jgi:hypothetical protein